MEPEIGGVITGGAVSFLLQKLDAIATREWNLDKNINRAVQNLTIELQSIEAELKDAASNNDPDHRLTAWLQIVRNQAYAIEDVLDLFRLHQDQQTVWRRFKMLHSINNLIKDVEGRLQRIQQTGYRYRTMTLPRTFHSAPNNANLPVREVPQFDGNVEAVGIEEPINKLISWAMEPKQRLEVMFVVGMAGLGKTTLVHNVYETVKKKKRFDRHVWITASTCKTTLDVLTLLVEQFSCPITQRGDVVALARKLLLNKWYVIVLDDLRVKGVWESVRLALPDDGKNRRIIITTRRGDIANSCRDGDSIDIHKLQPLSPERAAHLFYLKAFPRNGTCPSGLEEVSESILQKCDGLPLGITEIGSLLSNKSPTKNEWKKLHDSLV